MITFFGLSFPLRATVFSVFNSIGGVGPKYALYLCTLHGYKPETLLRDVSRNVLKNVMQITVRERLVLDALERSVTMSIRNKSHIRSYSGIRHMQGLPVRGQNTKTNAQTSKRLKRSFLKVNAN
jgi:small subunit ribosomal protein S13